MAKPSVTWEHHVVPGIESGLAACKIYALNPDLGLQLSDPSFDGQTGF